VLEGLDVLVLDCKVVLTGVVVLVDDATELEDEGCEVELCVLVVVFEYMLVLEPEVAT